MDIVRLRQIPIFVLSKKILHISTSLLVSAFTAFPLFLGRTSLFHDCFILKNKLQSRSFRRLLFTPSTLTKLLVNTIHLQPRRFGIFLITPASSVLVLTNGPKMVARSSLWQLQMPLSGVADADVMPAPPNTVRRRTKGASRNQNKKLEEEEKRLYKEESLPSRQLS